MEQDIKPCLCGSKAVVCRIRRIDQDYCTAYRVECPKGCVKITNAKTRDTAIKVWNGRVTRLERNKT